jgi:hypothetical protein
MGSRLSAFNGVAKANPPCPHQTNKPNHEQKRSLSMSSTKHSLQATHREINPHAAQPISLLAMSISFWRNRQLIVQITKREVIGRYKGSAMGLAWSFFNPVFMLVVYTFVFSEIFKSRWGGIGGDDSKTQFAVVLFVGMIVLSLFNGYLHWTANSYRSYCCRSSYSHLAFPGCSPPCAYFCVMPGNPSASLPRY